MSGEVVPFGKYRGQPVEALAADQDYAAWLLSQPWFRDRWPNVYNVVVAYGGEPQDSPEHNQMQARFLDGPWCLALADLLAPSWRDRYQAVAKAAEDDPLYQRFRAHIRPLAAEPPSVAATFEVRGWDVVVEVACAWLTAELESTPACICRCDHGECDDSAICHGGSGWCHHSACGGRGTGHPEARHCNRACPWADRAARDWLEGRTRSYWAGHPLTMRVELKPDLGDDYPGVLRQVKGYHAEYGDRRVVVVRRHAFEHVTWDQVQRVFAADKIRLITEAQIAAASPEAGG